MKFRKEGRGSLRFGNNIIKPGQVFEAEMEDIPVNFRDVIIPVKGSYDMEENIEPVKAEFFTKHRSGPWFDVVNNEGKIMNEKALSRDNALKLINDLS